MIKDKIENLRNYIELNNDFGKVAALLQDFDTFRKGLHAGRNEFAGETFYCNLDHSCLKTKNEALLEAHDAYIDLQIPLTAEEEMGWKERSECKNEKENHPERDIRFYTDAPTRYFRLKKGEMVLFFPSDAHAPLIGVGEEKEIEKIIFKIKVRQ